MSSCNGRALYVVAEAWHLRYRTFLPRSDTFTQPQSQRELFGHVLTIKTIISGLSASGSRYHRDIITEQDGSTLFPAHM